MHSELLILKYLIIFGKDYRKETVLSCLFSVYLKNWYHIGSCYKNGF